MYWCCVVVFKQKTAYEMRISDWSSDVCSSDLHGRIAWPAGLQPAIDRCAGHVLNRVKHFGYGKTAPIAAVERQRRLRGIHQLPQRENMGRGKVRHMDLVADHGAVAGVILGAENGAAGRSEGRRVGEEGVGTCG